MKNWLKASAPHNLEAVEKVGAYSKLMRRLLIVVLFLNYVALKKSFQWQQWRTCVSEGPWLYLDCSNNAGPTMERRWMGYKHVVVFFFFYFLAYIMYILVMVCSCVNVVGNVLFLFK